MARGIRCLVTNERRVSSQSGFGVPSQRGGVLVLWLVKLSRIDFTDSASHAEIGDFADTHFVDQHVLQLDISVNVAHVVHVLKTSHDLPEHHASVIMWEAGATVTFEDVVQGASRTVLSDEVVGEWSMLVFEKRKGVFVMERRPDLGFMV